MRKSAFLRRYKNILPEEKLNRIYNGENTTEMADRLVDEYRLVDGTHTRLRFSAKRLSKIKNNEEIANPVPVKLSADAIEAMNLVSLQIVVYRIDKNKLNSTLIGCIFTVSHLCNHPYHMTQS